MSSIPGGLSMTLSRIFILLCLFISATVSANSRTLLDRLALYPSTQALREGSTERKILPSGLEVWIHRRAALIGTNDIRHFSIIHFIGNASRAEVETPGINIMQLFPDDIELEVWSVNYPGYGGSPGEATFASFAPSALEVYDHLAKTTEDSNILISGTSIGSLAALYLASERPVNALILRNPVPLKELILENYGWWNLWLFAGPVSLQIPPQLNTIRNAAKTHIPALFLTSQNDSLIPTHLQQKIIDNYKGPYQHIFIEGIDHNDYIPIKAFPKIQDALKVLLK